MKNKPSGNQYNGQSNDSSSCLLRNISQSSSGDIAVSNESMACVELAVTSCLLYFGTPCLVNPPSGDWTNQRPFLIASLRSELQCAFHSETALSSRICTFSPSWIGPRQKKVKLRIISNYSSFRITLRFTETASQFRKFPSDFVIRETTGR